MNDLVKRLLNDPASWANNKEAADEIERLKEDNVALSRHASMQDEAMAKVDAVVEAARKVCGKHHMNCPGATLVWQALKELDK